MSFIDVLNEVPAPAWGLSGAIVGVVGTLGATIFTNRGANYRFEKQLKHEAEQRSRDRASELRRNVYLKAAEEIIAINTFFGQIAVVIPWIEQA